MNKNERREATKRAVAKALLSLDNDGARAILTGASTVEPLTKLGRQRAGVLCFCLKTKANVGHTYECDMTRAIVSRIGGAHDK